MIQRMLAAVATAVLAVVCVSCGGTAEGLSSVTGKVLCDGQPAAGAVLTFHRQAGGEAPPANAAAVIPTATVQDDGGFTVESHPLGYGAAPGNYTILVIWPDDSASPEASASRTPKSATIKGKRVIVANNNRDSRGTVDRLKGRYMDKSKSPLKAEIKPGPNDLGTLELSASTPTGK